MDDLPAEKLVTLEAQLKDVEEENKLLAAEVKSLSAGVRLSELPLTDRDAQPPPRTSKGQVYSHRFGTRRTECAD